jgi:hypothetical protein
MSDIFWSVAMANVNYLMLLVLWVSQYFGLSIKPSFIQDKREAPEIGGFLDKILIFSTSVSLDSSSSPHQ